MGTAVLGEKTEKSKLQPNGLKFTKFKIHLHSFLYGPAVWNVRFWEKKLKNQYYSQMA
jgi:hypothetical protein